MNPRYLAYCRAHGEDPAAMLAKDDERFPGGVMAGFILWVGEQWRAWSAESGRTRPFSAADHAAFDGWLRA